MTVRVFAPAKINLTLHVTGQRGDGYHLLDSLVAFADVGDWVSVAQSDGLSLEIIGPEKAGVPDGRNNSILQAARFYEQDGLAISLEKHLPTAAGIGGGTADAAATLRAISGLRDLALPDNVLPLGADVPVCLQGRVTRMSGIGEQLSAVPDLPDVWAVLVNPRLPVCTNAVFKALKYKNNKPMDAQMPKFNSATGLAAWLLEQRNDLQNPAIGLQPVISDVLTILAKSENALLARMSGSGATCFALFSRPDQAIDAAKTIAQNRPDWWVKSCNLS